MVLNRIIGDFNYNIVIFSLFIQNVIVRAILNSRCARIKFVQPSVCMCVCIYIYISCIKIYMQNIQASPAHPGHY